MAQLNNANIDMIQQSNPSGQGKAYEIKAIHDKMYKPFKGNPRQAFYLIEWKGYPSAEEYTWEPIKHLSEVKEMVDVFEKKWRRLKKKQEEQKEYKNQKHAKERSQIYNEASYQHSLGESQSSKLKYLRKGHEESTFTYKSYEDNILTHDKSQLRQQKQMKEERQASREQRKRHKDKDQDHKRHRQRTSAASNAVKSEHKSQLKMGKIVSHFYRDRQMFYEVEKLNANLKPVMTIFLPSEKARAQCLSSVTDYLEQYLIEIQEHNRPS